MIYDFSFQNPTRIHFGKTALTHLADELKEYGTQVLLVYGKSSIKKNGLYDQITATLAAAGKTVCELPGINSNPRYSQVLQGCELVRRHHVDLILAVGGGSVIDCAKGISAGAYVEGDLWERYYQNQEPLSNPVVPVGAILTMAGTGSEMNSGSVITNEDLQLKIGRVFPLAEMSPKFAILNPELTYTVPRYQMVSGIFDTLSHLMEQYFSGDDDNTSDYLLEGVMKSLVHSALIAVEKPDDYEARSNLMWCATMGLNKILGLSKTQDWMVHQIEHQLGAYTDCAHGAGLAIITPSYFRYIYRDGLSKFVRFARMVWNVDDQGQGDEQIALEGISRLEQFIRELGLPQSLCEVGATVEMLPLIAKSTDQNYKARFGTSFGGYKLVEEKEIMAILNACLW
ncbi:MAG: iron-containing alcohol dehydrogenase [Paludibacteraceae bacterium]|nr:iron-containing alcohol dehydrogenase [Paludibacteraceae bacterium]